MSATTIRSSAVITAVPTPYVERRQTICDIHIDRPHMPQLTCLGMLAERAAQYTVGQRIHFEALAETRDARVRADGRFGGSYATWRKTGRVIVQRCDTQPLPVLPARRRTGPSERAATASMQPPSLCLRIDDRADVYTSVDVGAQSALGYPYSAERLPDTEDHVHYRRYLLRCIERQSGEVYAALRAIAEQAIARTIVTLRPDLDDDASYARADVVRRAVVWMVREQLV